MERENQMIITTEDDYIVVLQKKSGVVTATVCEGYILSSVIVDETTIKAEIDKPLEYDYFYGYAFENREHFDTAYPVKKIEGSLY